MSQYHHMLFLHHTANWKLIWNNPIKGYLYKTYSLWKTVYYTLFLQIRIDSLFLTLLRSQMRKCWFNVPISLRNLTWDGLQWYKIFVRLSTIKRRHYSANTMYVVLTHTLIILLGCHAILKSDDVHPPFIYIIQHISLMVCVCHIMYMMWWNVVINIVHLEAVIV